MFVIILQITNIALYLHCKQTYKHTNITNKLNDMGTMTKNGISTTTAPGSEQYKKFTTCGIDYYQYEYTHLDGTDFRTVGASVEECRAKRDEWIKSKDNGKD